MSGSPQSRRPTRKRVLTLSAAVAVSALVAGSAFAIAGGTKAADLGVLPVSEAVSISNGAFSAELVPATRGPLFTISRPGDEAAPPTVGFACLEVEPVEPLQLCGAHQRRGERAVVVGRVGPGVREVDGNLNGELRSSTVVGDGVFLSVGDVPNDPSDYGLAPDEFVVRGEGGEILKVVENPGSNDGLDE